MRKVITGIQEEAKMAHRIVSRHKSNLSAPAAPADFALSDESIDEQTFKSLTFTPYAIDAAKAAVIEVGMLTVPAKLSRAFFYLDQFEEAEAVRSIPVSKYHTDQSDALNRGEGRTFVFSIGRAGSTLFSRILNTGGTVSISEPDVLLHLSQPKLVESIGLSASDWPIVYETALRRLETAHGGTGPFAIKYRAQSSNKFHIERLSARFPKAQFVFLFRDPVNWSVSFAKKFGFKAATMQWLFSQALNACESLTRAGLKVTVFDYDQIVANPTSILDQLVPDHIRADTHQSLERVMSEDSQHGLFVKPITTKATEAEASMAW